MEKKSPIKIAVVGFSTMSQKSLVELHSKIRNSFPNEEYVVIDAKDVQEPMYIGQPPNHIEKEFVGLTQIFHSAKSSSQSWKRRGKNTKC